MQYYFGIKDYIRGATLSLDKEKNIADVFYHPLLICILGFVLIFIALTLIGCRTEIKLRRYSAIAAKINT